MKHAKDLLGTPTKDVLQIEHRGIRYIATEEDCRFLQAQVCLGKLNFEDYKVFDLDIHGEEYELGWHPTDATFYKSMTSNTYSLCSSYTLVIIGERRKRNKIEKVVNK